MSPYVLFRMWVRRASYGQRVTTAMGAAVVVAMIAWIAVPSADSANRVATAGGGFSPVAGATAGSSTTTANSSTSGTGGGSGGPAQPSSATQGPASSQGGSGAVTGSSATGGGSTPQGCAGPLSPVKIGVIIPDVGSGSASLNSTFGIPSASEEQSDYQAVFDSINKSGGVACHSLVGDYAVFNETDSTAAQTECLQFVQDKVFAVLGGWLPSSSDTCAVQNHLPTIEQELIPASQVKQFYPYYLSTAGELDLLFHNFAHALTQMGYFSASKGFKKLGIFYRDCISGEYQSLVAQLEQAGLAASAIDSFDVGCSSSPFAPPSTVESAILQFQRDGVTDVTPMNEYEDLQAFTRQANSQGYKPQYLVEDDGIVATSSSTTFSPDATNFDGAVGITPYQYAAIATGLPETATTKQCDQIMTSHGLPTVYQSGDQFAGVVCSLAFMLQAGIAHDPTLRQESLAPGLQAAGSVNLSFPDGPNDFKSSGGTFGGEYWRPLVFQASCSCWKVTNPNFSPSFP